MPGSTPTHNRGMFDLATLEQKAFEQAHVSPSQTDSLTQNGYGDPAGKGPPLLDGLSPPADALPPRPKLGRARAAGPPPGFGHVPAPHDYDQGPPKGPPPGFSSNGPPPGFHGPFSEQTPLQATSQGPPPGFAPPGAPASAQGPPPGMPPPVHVNRGRSLAELEAMLLSGGAAPPMPPSPGVSVLPPPGPQVPNLALAAAAVAGEAPTWQQQELLSRFDTEEWATMDEFAWDSEAGGGPAGGKITEVAQNDPNCPHLFPKNVSKYWFHR
eukprot:gene22491-29617_t